MRSAINTFQALANQNEVLELSDIENITTKDDRSTIINGVTAVLKSKNPNHVKKALMVEEDPTLVMEYIAENIPREYTKKKEIKKAYENIAKADLYFGRARSSRYYSYWKYATDFMGVGVSDAKDETYKKFTRITSPTVFTLMGRNRGKRNLRDRIAEKMSQKLHISHSVAISMFPYLEIMFENNELAWEISDFLGFEEDEIKRFRTRKIPKKVIEKMEKQKAQKRVEQRDARAQEIQDGLMATIPPQKEVKEEPAEEIQEEVVDEIKEETDEEIQEESQKEVEEKPKKKTDKQVSLFNF